MRKLPTSLGPHIINHTIILGIQKCTWHTFQDVIILFINAQVLVNELLRLLAQVFGNSLNVGSSEKWPGGLAAIGALETVGSAELGGVQFLHHIVDVLRRLLFELIKVLLVLDMLIFGQLGQQI